MSKSTELTRRALILGGGVALFGAASGVLPLFLRRAAAAGFAAAARPRVLVVVFQRFGMDGLMAVAPYADADLARLRPNLMLSRPGSGKEDARIDLDGRFGLHPALAPLLPLYREGALAIVHGAGSPDRTRSHSEAQLGWESGTPGERRHRDGWLNRAIAAAPGLPEARLRAAAWTAERPRIFYGREEVVSLESVDSLRLAETADAGLIHELEAEYRASSHPLLQRAGERSFGLAQALAASTREAGKAQEWGYPAGSALGKSLREIADVIHADLGLQVAFAESRKGAGEQGTWDIHSSAAKSFPPVAADLAVSLAAFWKHLGPRREDVALVTLTDFGRNVVENEKLGTDHGRATAMFALGGALRGGRVYGTLPERFERDALEDQMDLPVTTDFRSVLAGLTRSQLGIRDVASVFPGWSGVGLELARS